MMNERSIVGGLTDTNQVFMASVFVFLVPQFSEDSCTK